MLNMNSPLIKDFLYSINAAEISDEYIHSIRVTYEDGQNAVLKGEELKKLLNGDPMYANVETSNVMLNVQKLVDAIQIETDYLYHVMMKRLKKDWGEE